MTRSLPKLGLALFLVAATLLGSSGTNVALALSDPTPHLQDPSPTSATAGVATTLEAYHVALPSMASYNCRFVINDGAGTAYASPSGTALAGDGTIAASYTFATAGSYKLEAHCWSSNGGYSVWSDPVTVAVTTDGGTVTPPGSISAVAPTSATAGAAVELGVSYSGFTGGVGECHLIIGSNDVGAMSLSSASTGASGTAKRSHTFSEAGSYEVFVSCGGGDAYVMSSTANVTVSAGASSSDTAAPSVGIVSPRTATAGSMTDFSVTYSDAGSGVASCTLYVTGSANASITMTRVGTPASGTATAQYKPTSAGTLSFGARCTDLAGNTNEFTGYSVVVSAATGGNSDTIAPTVGSITPTTATAGTAVTFSAAYSDTGTGVSACSLIVNGGTPSAMTLTGTGSSGTASKAHTFTAAGSATVAVQCVDGASNAKTSGPITLTVAAAASGTGPDTVLPVVGSVTPSAATVNAATAFSATYADGVGVTACYLYVDGISAGAMTRSSSATAGTASLSYTFTSTGSRPVRVECVDAAGNRGVGTSATVTVAAAGVDVTMPTVGSVLPAAVTVGESALFSADYADAVGVTACYLYVDGVSAGSMSRSSSATSGSASMGYTIASSGAHAVRVECVDAAGNRGIGSSTTVTASGSTTASGADTSLPVVGLVSPSTAVTNVTTTYAVAYSDNVGVTACYLYADNVGVGAMTRSTGTAAAGVMSANYRFTSAGSRSVRVECVDAAGNRGTGGASTVVVGATASTADTAVPVVSAIVRPTLIAAGVSNRYTVFVTDASPIASCRLSANGTVVATLTVANANGQTYATAGADYAFPSAGGYALRVECTDAAGNRGVSPSETMTVTAASGTSTGATTDPFAPRISAVTPGAVGTGAATSYAVAYTSGVGVISCSLYLNGTYLGSMGLSGASTNGQANYLHTFSAPGTYQLHAECIDDARVRGIGPNTNVTVSLDGTVPAGTSAAVSNPTPGSLIKLVCPDGAASDHPCKAVYYYGFDGMRHAFPHERVFFTWFSNFNNIVEVTDAAMSAIRLGRTVTYRPGVRLLKFRTVPRVYALTRGGVLRWVTSESAAATLYGADWAQRVDDIQDAFYSDYMFGANIDSASDYNAESERNTVSTIDANL